MKKLTVLLFVLLIFVLAGVFIHSEWKANRGTEVDFHSNAESVSPPVPVPAIDEPLCPQVASYTIDVRLDTENNLITGTERLTWTNTTDNAAIELWFHLYWNAFSNTDSTFLRESSRRGRSFAHFREEDWGYCRIQSIFQVNGNSTESPDLSPLMEFRHPDDDNTLDRTVFSISLPLPVAPGETVTLDIAFESGVPRPISRTGVYKDYYFIAQWFPKIGVLENGEWNCHQFHSPGEFFADYGTYDVRITLPSSYIVGATGEHRDLTDNGDGTTTHRFVQHSVHDFAWTASPDYLKHTEVFEFLPGRTTEITLLYQPSHSHLRERYLQAVRNAIHFCSLWYGAYPYTTATCVDPAFNSRAGGMEYPTLFTGGAYFLSPERVHSPEGVTIHEFGHGYFYGLVGSNEFENAWMDEGLTSFLDSAVTHEAYGPPLYSRRFFGVPVTFKEVPIPIESGGIDSHRNTSDMDILQRYAWEYLDGGSYSANAYSKAELLLRTLQRVMGEDVFGNMIKTYSQRWWFRHPRPQDFYDAVNEFADRDMSPFLDQVIYGSGQLDYGIGQAESRRPPAGHGLYEGRFLKGHTAPGADDLFETEVVVRRFGEVTIPVEVLFQFEDGREIREIWNGEYRWRKFLFTHAAKLNRVIVDPDFKLVLDVNRTNNSRILKPDRLSPFKWTTRWLMWLQHALEMLTIFGG